MADPGIFDLVESAGDFFPAYAVAWAAGSVALFRFSKVVTSAAVPGFPREFLSLLLGTKDFKAMDYGAVFVEQMDRLFRFESRSFGKKSLRLPKLSRSMVASLVTILMVSIVLTLSGFSVWRETIGFVTGESINEAVADVYGRTLPEQLRGLHLIMGLVTGAIAFLINLYADYFSLAQTRYFIERANLTKGLSTVLVVIADLAVSVMLLLVSVSLGLLATCVLMYFAGFFVWETFSENVQYLLIPAIAVSFSLMYDSIALLFGGSEISGNVITYFNQLHGVPIGFPTPKLVFLTWVCSSIMSSAWLWLNLVAIIIAKLVSFAPSIAKTLIKWTKAKEDPHRLVATFVVLAWSIVWILPIGSV